MTDSATQLEKLEAEQAKAAAVLAEANAKLADFRNQNRGPRLAELKKHIADYSFTVAELFGEAGPSTAKPKVKAGTGKRSLSVVKFRDEHGNTWGGSKGPRPAWVKVIKDAGGDMEKYRVAP